jgi:hypothetical protein
LSRQPTYMTELKRLSRERPNLVDTLLHSENLRLADDRAAAIVVSTRLEDELKELILSKMIPLNQTEIAKLFVGDSPVASFSAKISLAYALGSIGKQSRDDLNLVRLIRNAFAHARKPITFETTEIATACNRLTLPDRYHAIDQWKGIEMPINTPRRRFVATTQLYGLGIMYVLRNDIMNFENNLNPVVPLN